MRQPNIFQLDGLTVDVQIRAEAFNILNRPNFAVPSGRIAFTNAAGDIAPNWGRITSTVTTSRQIQIGAKYLF